MTAIKDMTPAQIKARLAEIKTREAELVPNFQDATQAIYEALMNGGDVAAVENDTDAEAQQRAANAKEKRRLDIEKKALHAAMPQATAREGENSITKLHSQHEDLGAQAEQTRDELLAAAKALEDAAARWTQLREQGSALGHEARQIASGTGASQPDFGVFTSDSVASAIGSLRGLVNRTHAHSPINYPSPPLD